MGDSDGPHVGIFFYVEDELVILSVPVFSPQKASCETISVHLT